MVDEYKCPRCGQSARRYLASNSRKQTMRVVHENWCPRWRFLTTRWPSLAERN